MARFAPLAALLATCLVAPPASAQTPETGTIEGRVRGPDGPIAGARVELEGATPATTTDTLGRYRLDDIPAGRYRLTIAAIGYAPAEQWVAVRPGAVVTADATLARRVQRLAEVSVTGARPAPRAVDRLPDVSDGVVYVGKKTELLALDSLDVNAVQNVSRQVLGRIPGLTVAETEGQGFPANGIGFRGLNATQSVEVNLRQDGYNIAADPYGYPEAYFVPPTEAVERVELVRGASSLAFGSQFGGVVNYVLRDGVQGPPVVRARLAAGSFGSFGGFGDVGGGAGAFTYYGFAQYRTQSGWRPNDGIHQVTGFGRLRWQASDRFRLGLEYTLFRNRIQMPGGLTDEAFAADPRASFRTRNWLASPWNLLALTADYAPSSRVSLRTTVWGNLSQRYLVWRNEDGGAGAPDAIDPATGEFVPREVERETFTNLTAESRLTYSYPLLGRIGTLAVGVRGFTGRMHRQGGGPGSTGSDFDTNLYGGPYGYDITFYNTNLAAHAEQVVRLGDRVTVTPGLRLEHLRSSADGYTDTSFTGVARRRTFLLPGVSSEVRTSSATALYGSLARAYRPIDYSSLTPFATVSRIDPNLHDASGLSADLGWRGEVGAVSFDLSVFRIRYGDRIGLVSGVDPDGTPFTLRTNVAASVHRGVESYVQLRLFDLAGAPAGLGDLSIFDAFAYTDAKYVEGEFAGNRVEYAPEFVNRVGLSYGRRALSGTLQLSTVSSAFGDANNTAGGDDANVGLIPSYQVLDFSTRLRLGPRYTLSAGVNNLTDERYFTRRTDEYPGPGIIPSPGRSVYLSAGATF
jgi:Fe(3+) dicitrate transport protein